jgi:hypothetical protein
MRCARAPSGRDRHDRDRIETHRFGSRPSRPGRSRRANHYRDAMGLRYSKFYGEPPSFAILNRDGMYLMLKQIEDQTRILPHLAVSSGLWNVYFWVSAVDALHDEFVRRGVRIDYGVCDQLYGCREFGVQDIDGYGIGFGFGQMVGPDRL